MERELNEILQRFIPRADVKVRGVARDLINGELALVAVEGLSSKLDERLGDLIAEFRAELQMNEVMLIDWDADIRQFICNAFTPVCVKDVVIEFDPLQQMDVAKVVLSDKQLEAALGETGVRARLAAMLTGQDLEIVLG